MYQLKNKLILILDLLDLKIVINLMNLIFRIIKNRIYNNQQNNYKKIFQC